MEPLYKAYSIIPNLKTKELIRVDWRCYARVIDRVAGYLTREEVDWLGNYLKEAYQISLKIERLEPPFEDEFGEYEDIELTPVQLIRDSEIDFAKQIFGYVASFPLENVDSVNEFLKLIDEPSQDEERDNIE